MTSLTQIRKILKQAVFNPRKPGPMKIVAEMGNSQYYKMRAIEAISNNELYQAIKLLALAIASIDDEEEKD